MIYFIVNLVLLAILLVALAALTHLSCRNIPLTPVDPSRAFLPYYSWTLYLSLGTASILFLTTALSLAEWYIYNRPLLSAVTHLASIGHLLSIFALCALLQTIARLAIGLRVASTNGTYTSNKFAKSINVLTGIGAVAWTLWWINRQVALSRMWRNGEYNSGYGVANFVFAIIGLVGFAAMLAAGITVLVYAIKGRGVVSGKDGYAGIGKRVITIASVNIVILAWTIVGTILFGSAFGGFWAGWLDIIDIFIVKYAAVGILTVVYLVAKRKEGGLWSEGIFGPESGRNSGDVGV